MSKKSEKLTKTINLEEENQMFRRDATYDDIKSYIKSNASPSLHKIPFWKNHKFKLTLPQLFLD